MSRGVVAVCAWVVAVSGCLVQAIRSEVTPLDGARCEPPTKRSPDTVAVFFGPEQPKLPFDRVALLELEGESYVNTRQLLGALRARAASCGADAVIAVDRKYGVREDDSLFGSDRLKEIGVVTGVAITYRDLPPDEGRAYDPSEWED